MAICGTVCCVTEAVLALGIWIHIIIFCVSFHVICAIIFDKKEYSVKDKSQDSSKNKSAVNTSCEKATPCGNSSSAALV